MITANEGINIPNGVAIAKVEDLVKDEVLLCPYYVVRTSVRSLHGCLQGGGGGGSRFFSDFSGVRPITFCG